MAEKRAVTMDKLVSLCKNRGFIFPGSEIYGGLANTWDFGPLGVELKNNVKKAWWKKFVQENPHNTGLDCAILMNPRTWQASGHLGGFSDPLMDCKSCKARHRADNLVEAYAAKKGLDIKVESMDNDALEAFIRRAIEADMRYMHETGVLDGDGLMGDGEYDDDDAFEALLDALSVGVTDEHEIDRIAQLLDSYMAAQQAYLEASGLME